MNSKSIRKYNLILFFLLASLHPLFSQDSLVVNGKIVANKDKPVEDVGVSVERADVEPVLTDENGEFTITVPSGNDWLMINPIGEYKSKRVFLNDRTEVLISLAEEDMKSAYDDVQLVNRRENRKDVIGSFTDIDPDFIQNRNIASIEQAFQGRVPGMFTTNHSGMPGQGAVSFIRGIQSQNASNAPLVIVDGMPLEQPDLFSSNIDGNAYNPLSNINPYDISNVTILNDYTGTAMYGTKGSNGVVLIKTLDPQSTQTSIDVTLESGMNLSPDQYIPQLNDKQYKSLANEVLVSSHITEDDFEDEYPGLYMDPGDNLYYEYMHNTQWQKLVFSNALLSNAHLSVKGGSEIATYGLSVGYYDQGGVFDNTSYNRLNVRFVSNLNVFSWLDMNVNVNITNSNSTLKEGATSPETNPILTSLGKPPILSPYQYDKDGNQLERLDEVDELGTSNPLAVMQNFNGENKNTRFITSIYGDADISESLNFNTLFGLNFNTMDEVVFLPNKGMARYFSGEAINVSQFTNNHLFSFYNDNRLHFNKQYNSIHSLDASVGFRIYTNSFETDFGRAMNLPENDQYTNLQEGQSDLRYIEGQNAIWNWLSAYNQITYKLRDKYILNTGLSADFSTRTGKAANTAFHIGDDVPVGLFYSVGAGWRMSSEDFLKQVRGLENLMLRASYGITGNNDIGNYNALDYYETRKYRSTSGLIPGAMPNNRIKYETSNQLNAGVSLSLWGSRTLLDADYYITTNTDMMIYKPQNSYTGYRYKPENSGVVQNNGWEFSLFQRIIDGQTFKWDIKPVVSFVSNEVIDAEGSELVTSFEGGEMITREGDPINSFYGYQFEGVFATQAEAEEANLVNDKGITFGAGDAIFKDVSGPDDEPDGVIDNHDKVNLGTPIPDFYGSFTNSFKYKKWSLDMMIQFVYGNEVFNYQRYSNENMVDLSNQSKNVLNRWQQEGDNTDVPRALWNDPVGNSGFSSRWIEDGSYARLKNVTLGYHIPEEFLVFKSARFYITATNLITLDNYLGYDPEFSYSFSSMKQGIDYGLMPQYRQFLFGINLGL